QHARLPDIETGCYRQGPERDPISARRYRNAQPFAPHHPPARELFGRRPIRCTHDDHSDRLPGTEPISAIGASACSTPRPENAEASETQKAPPAGSLRWVGPAKLRGSDVRVLTLHTCGLTTANGLVQNDLADTHDLRSHLDAF